jgi:hypothetical protein
MCSCLSLISKLFVELTLLFLKIDAEITLVLKLVMHVIEVGYKMYLFMSKFGLFTLKSDSISLGVVKSQFLIVKLGSEIFEVALLSAEFFDCFGFI